MRSSYWDQRLGFSSEDSVNNNNILLEGMGSSSNTAAAAVGYFGGGNNVYISTPAAANNTSGTFSSYSGRSVPLPPMMNSTAAWGNTTTSQQGSSNHQKASSHFGNGTAVTAHLLSTSGSSSPSASVSASTSAAAGRLRGNANARGGGVNENGNSHHVVDTTHNGKNSHSSLGVNPAATSAYYHFLGGGGGPLSYTSTNGGRPSVSMTSSAGGFGGFAGSNSFSAPFGAYHGSSSSGEFHPAKEERRRSTSRSNSSPPTSARFFSGSSSPSAATAANGVPSGATALTGTASHHQQYRYSVVSDNLNNPTFAMVRQNTLGPNLKGGGDANDVPSTRVAAGGGVKKPLRKFSTIDEAQEYENDARSEGSNSTAQKKHLRRHSAAQGPSSIHDLDEEAMAKVLEEDFGPSASSSSHHQRQHQMNAGGGVFRTQSASSDHVAEPMGRMGGGRRSLGPSLPFSSSGTNASAKKKRGPAAARRQEEEDEEEEAKALARRLEHLQNRVSRKQEWISKHQHMQEIRDAHEVDKITSDRREEAERQQRREEAEAAAARKRRRDAAISSMCRELRRALKKKGIFTMSSIAVMAAATRAVDEDEASAKAVKAAALKQEEERSAATIHGFLPSHLKGKGIAAASFLSGLNLPEHPPSGGGAEHSKIYSASDDGALARIYQQNNRSAGDDRGEQNPSAATNNNKSPQSSSPMNDEYTFFASQYNFAEMTGEEAARAREALGARLVSYLDEFLIAKYGEEILVGNDATDGGSNSNLGASRDGCIDEKRAVAYDKLIALNDDEEDLLGSDKLGGSRSGAAAGGGNSKNATLSSLSPTFHSAEFPLASSLGNSRAHSPAISSDGSSDDESDLSEGSSFSSLEDALVSALNAPIPSGGAGNVLAGLLLFGGSSSSANATGNASRSTSAASRRVPSPSSPALPLASIAGGGGSTASRQSISMSTYGGLVRRSTLSPSNQPLPLPFGTPTSPSDERNHSVSESLLPLGAGESNTANFKRSTAGAGAGLLGLVTSYDVTLFDEEKMKRFVEVAESEAAAAAREAQEKAARAGSADEQNKQQEGEEEQDDGKNGDLSKDPPEEEKEDEDAYETEVIVDEDGFISEVKKKKEKRASSTAITNNNSSASAAKPATFTTARASLANRSAEQSRREHGGEAESTSPAPTTTSPALTLAEAGRLRRSEARRLERAVAEERARPLEDSEIKRLLKKLKYRQRRVVILTEISRSVMEKITDTIGPSADLGAFVNGIGSGGGGGMNGVANNNGEDGRGGGGIATSKADYLRGRYDTTLQHNNLQSQSARGPAASTAQPLGGASAYHALFGNTETVGAAFLAGNAGGLSPNSARMLRNSTAENPTINSYFASKKKGADTDDPSASTTAVVDRFTEISTLLGTASNSVTSLGRVGAVAQQQQQAAATRRPLSATTPKGNGNSADKSPQQRPSSASSTHALQIIVRNAIAVASKQSAAQRLKAKKARREAKKKLLDEGIDREEDEAAVIIRKGALNNKKQEAATDDKDALLGDPSIYLTKAERQFVEIVKNQRKAIKNELYTAERQLRRQENKNRKRLAVMNTLVSAYESRVAAEKATEKAAEEKERRRREEFLLAQRNARRQLETDFQRHVVDRLAEEEAEELEFTLNSYLTVSHEVAVAKWRRRTYEELSAEVSTKNADNNTVTNGERKEQQQEGVKTSTTTTGKKANKKDDLLSRSTTFEVPVAVLNAVRDELAVELSHIPAFGSTGNKDSTPTANNADGGEDAAEDSFPTIGCGRPICVSPSDWVVLRGAIERYQRALHVLLHQQQQRIQGSAPSTSGFAHQQRNSNLLLIGSHYVGGAAGNNSILSSGPGNLFITPRARNNSDSERLSLVGGGGSTPSGNNNNTTTNTNLYSSTNASSAQSPSLGLSLNAPLSTASGTGGIFSDRSGYATSSSYNTGHHYSTNTNNNNKSALANGGSVLTPEAAHALLASIHMHLGLGGSEVETLLAHQSRSFQQQQQQHPEASNGGNGGGSADTQSAETPRLPMDVLLLLQTIQVVDSIDISVSDEILSAYAVRTLLTNTFRDEVEARDREKQTKTQEEEEKEEGTTSASVGVGSLCSYATLALLNPYEEMDDFTALFFDWEGSAVEDSLVNALKNDGATAMKTATSQPSASTRDVEALVIAEALIAAHTSSSHADSHNNINNDKLLSSSQNPSDGAPNASKHHLMRKDENGVGSGGGKGLLHPHDYLGGGGEVHDCESSSNANSLFAPPPNRRLNDSTSTIAGGGGRSQHNTAKTTAAAPEDDYNHDHDAKKNGSGLLVGDKNGEIKGVVAGDQDSKLFGSSLSNLSQKNNNGHHQQPTTVQNLRDFVGRQEKVEQLKRILSSLRQKRAERHRLLDDLAVMTLLTSKLRRLKR